MKCVACKRPAQVKIIWPFCRDCFLRHYERRVERVIKRYSLIEAGDRILVCVSGGKDSLSCAHILSKLRKVLKFQMEVLYIDVGISSCTNERTQEIVRAFCEERDVALHIFRFSDFFSFSLEEASRKLRRKLCSLCGAFKRYTFNRFARENNFNKIATGHCADDAVRFFFKNWFSGNFSWIDKLKPHTASNHSKLVERIRPLFETLEEENLLYTQFNHIVVAGCSRCSYFLRKDKWNGVLKVMEEKRPGFKLDFVRSLSRVRFFLKENKTLKECSLCGEPTDQDICSVCRIKQCFTLS